MFIKELKKFSKENWWIYLLLAIALVIVYITGKGNLIEIIILFLANFLGNLFIMVMQGNYTAKNNKIGAIYHLSATLTFTSISIYGFYVLEQSQYIIWQVTYILAAFKAFSFYNFGKNFKHINSYTIGFINILLFGLFSYVTFKGIDIITLTGTELYKIIGMFTMGLGFSLVTTSLVNTNDVFRYWLSLFGVAALVLGSGILLVASYLTENGTIDGIALGYLILTGTVFVYYTKLIKKYL